MVAAKVRELFKYFPDTVMNIFLATKDADIEEAEEIRLRAGKPAMLYKPDGSWHITASGSLTRDLSKQCLCLAEEDLKKIFFSLARHSVYAYETEIKNGFITIDNGFRVGIAGSVMSENGRVKGFKNINALNIRIPRQLSGISRMLLRHISRDERLLSTLIISAPQLGKTTLIRDIARAAGSGEGLKKHKVCIVDERSELAALKEGSPQFDIGLETDVLDGMYKSEGILMALRALSPDVVVTDEIGREADLAAIREALNGGVTIVATAHGGGVEDLKKRLFFSKLLAEHAFERLVVLSEAFGKITVSSVQNGDEIPLVKEPLLLKV